MGSKSIEPIFNLDDVLEFNYNRNKEDYVKIATTTNVNYANGGIVNFEVNNQQYYINIAESFIAAEFICSKDGTAANLFAAGDNVALINNFFPHLFSQIELSVGGRIIESIQMKPGEASTMANFIMMPEASKRASAQITGWLPDVGKGDLSAAALATMEDYNISHYQRKKVYNAKGTYAINFPLKYLFGFTEYKKILYLIKLGLKFTLDTPANSASTVFLGTGAPLTAKIILQNMTWWIPYIDPSDEVRSIVDKRLNMNTPIDCIFMERRMNTATIPTGSKYDWALGNYSNSIRFVFVCFKSVTPPTMTNNNCLFTEHADGAAATKITALRLNYNNLAKPVDRMQFDFEKYIFNEPYQAYVDACATFGNDANLSMQQFHDLHPIFCFDISAQPEQLKTNGIYLSLAIEKVSALTLNAYALVLSDAYYKISTGNGSMLRIE